MDGKLRFVETLTSGLESMLSTGNHADVTIVVDGKVFPCHKVVLCAMSPYFDAMFSHDMVETRGGIVTLHDIEPNTFSTILKFMYTGEEVVEHSNAESIFRASSMLQIPCLQERCEEFLIHQVSKDNCIGIWKIAKAQNCTMLTDVAFLTFLEQFVDVCNSEEFQTLDADELLTIIKQDALEAQDEETVCSAVMSWLKYDPSRSDKLHLLLQGLRLPLVSPEFLFNFLEDEAIEIGPEAQAHINSAFKYQLCPSRRASFASENFTHRRASKDNDCLVIVGGLLKTIPRFQTTKEVVCYSFQQEQWYYLPSLPYDPGYEFAICEHGSDIYVSGGWLKLQGMTVYKSNKNKWKTCDSMTNGRCGHSMVPMTDAIFVLGGRDGKAPAMTNIEKFDLKSKKWTLAGELLLGIRSMSTAAVGENIFVFGGITENDKDSDKVQCFDTRLETATIIGCLPFTCRLTRTVTCNETIYIVLPDGRVMKFDQNASRKRIESVSEMSFSFDAEDTESQSGEVTFPTDGAAAMLPSPVSPKLLVNATISEKEDTLCRVVGRIRGFNQHHFEMVQFRGDLLLAGGKTPDNTILRSILVLDPVSTDIRSDITMPSARWCFGCAKIAINKMFLSNAISRNAGVGSQGLQV